MKLNGKQFSLFILISLTVAMGFLAWAFTAPEHMRGKSVVFRLERGESLKSVSARLADAKIVPSAPLFYFYMRLTRKSGKIKSGQYRLPVRAGIIYTAQQLLDPSAGDVIVQVREGLTIWQTAGVIAQELSIDSAKFVELCGDSAFIHSLGFPGDTSIEGYLYPETYHFQFDADEKMVIKKMTSTFHEVHKELPKQGRGAALSRNELVSLAAIVEKEAQVASERAVISAVFHNRLEQGIPLGADPTIRYALKKFSGPIYKSELQNRSPYNTRIHKGLTPGPICSPGKAALEAAVNPADSEELFFVAKWDGSGEHYFSKTNAEHDSLKMMVRNAKKELSNW